MLNAQALCAARPSTRPERSACSLKAPAGAFLVCSDVRYRLFRAAGHRHRGAHRHRAAKAAAHGAEAPAPQKPAEEPKPAEPKAATEPKAPEEAKALEHKSAGLGR